MSAPAGSRAPRWPGGVAGAAVAVAVLLAVAGLGLVVLTADASQPATDGLTPSTVVERLTFMLGTSIGAVIVWRRPRLAVGWLLIAISLGTPLAATADVYARHAIATGADLPAWRFAAWLTNWTWALTSGGVIPLLLLFPTGRPLSRRWAIVTRVAWVEFGLLLAVLALAPGPLLDFSQVGNPVGLSVLPAGFSPLLGALFICLEVFTLVGLVGLAVRYRRSRGEERLQLKWVAWAAGILVGAIVVVPLVVGEANAVAEAVGGVALLGAVGVALLRYRLYAIDRIVSRTVTYAVVTSVLVAVYAGSVLALRPILDPLTGGSDLAVAGSTLVVAALFGPLRRRVQTTVDHRFNRRQYDAARAVELFGQRLRDEVDLHALVDDLRGTVSATIEPANVSLWLPDEVTR